MSGKEKKATSVDGAATVLEPLQLLSLSDGYEPPPPPPIPHDTLLSLAHHAGVAGPGE